MARLAVAVSGGVDSLYALVSLREQGHDLLALHGRFLPPSAAADKEDPVPALHRVCAALGVELQVLELAQAFDAAVVAPFVRAYAEGRTPNPCALCNARVKFGLLLDAALERGAEGLATGHYARLHEHARYGRVLAQGSDAAKDQSYFLALVPRQRLELAHFPLAGISKQDARACLAARGIAVPLPRESQEICFVPADRYRPFLEAQAATRCLTLGAPGPMLLHAGSAQERVVARHQGLWQYTEGQRKGLGVAWSEPLFVLGKDTQRNALLLGTREQLDMRGCVARDLNVLVSPSLWPEDLTVRVRYRQQAVAAQVILDGTEALLQTGKQERVQAQDIRIVFAEAQPPTAPGQVAVVYDTDGVVMAGGVMVRSL